MNAALALQSPSFEVAEASSFSIPIADMYEFTAIPEPRRVEIQVALRVLERLHAHIPVEGKMKALKFVAAMCQHQMRGLSPVTLDRKYKAYLSGGWRALVKGYKGPNQQPAAFIEEIRRVVELNHRSATEALRQLQERWAAGESIPGYGTWVEYYIERFPERAVPSRWPRNFYPPGWSVGNMRKYGPSKASVALFQRGIAGSKKHFPCLIRDTSALRPLEYITIDDFELDCLCVFAGSATLKPQIGRVAGLMALDVATRRKLHWGVGQRLEREETQPDGTVKTVRTGISRIDVQLFLQGLFDKYGLPEYTVTLLVENGSASISPELQLSIDTLFGGRVRIERTGMIDHRNLTNGFVERGGRPWEKGWIESAFNLLWNVLGAMKGYKGSNQRLNAPVGLEDKIRYTKLLIGQGEKSHQLPPEVVSQLRLPFASIEEIERSLAWAIALVDSRTDHRYRGFDRVKEFVLEEGSEPQPMEALALLSQDQQLSAEVVDRSESSIERWNRLSSGVTFNRIPAATLAIFLLTPKRVKYRNNAVTFDHDKVGYSYIDPKGEVLRGVQDGTEFLGYFSPSSPEHLHITELNGSLTGTLVRLGGRRGAIDIRDKEAIKLENEQLAQVFNRVKGEVNQRHAGLNQELAADRAHNDNLINLHEESTKSLSKVERIAMAAGEAAATRAQQQATKAALSQVSDEDLPSLL